MLRPSMLRPPPPPLLLLLLLLLLRAQVATAATDPGDVKALCELFFATNGPGWGSKSGWTDCRSDGTASSDPCASGAEWYNYGGGLCDTSVTPSRINYL
jgi:hypothetical protein